MMIGVWYLTPAIWVTLMAHEQGHRSFGVLVPSVVSNEDFQLHLPFSRIQVPQHASNSNF